jgi:hypothetical protein
MAIDPELIYIEILETVLMATLDPDLWKSALQKLALLTGHQYAAFLFYDKGNAHLLTDSFLLEEKVFTAYRDVFLAIDPAEKILTALPVGQMYRDREYLGDNLLPAASITMSFITPTI